MAGITFLMALGALVLAVIAYRRTAAPSEWENQMNALRDKTADTLSKMEKSLRKENKSDLVEPPGS
jgi:ABC-type transporter MlaC component